MTYETVEMLMKRAERLEQQRAELLEALKALESAAAFAAIDDDVERAAVGAALEYARAVIAAQAKQGGAA